MNRPVLISALSTFLTVMLTVPSFGTPLTGAGILPFPGATGDPPRDIYLPVGPGTGPFTGTWPGGGPNTPALPAWWGTFSATGPMPHTPPSGPPATGTALYDFTVGTFPGLLPVGTYFSFGDLDAGSGSGENFTLRAFDAGGTPITSAWLDVPFAASGILTALTMPSYSLTSGVYFFDGASVLGNPFGVSYLKNNTAIGFLEVTRASANASFILAAPVPEPGSAVLAIAAFGMLYWWRKRFM